MSSNEPDNSNRIPGKSPLVRLLQAIVQVERHEVSLMLWSCAYSYCLLSGYYIIRPMRDAMGIVGGTGNLQWLQLATFLSMLAVVPIYTVLIVRYPRHRFIPIAYRFVILNLIIFYLLFNTLSDQAVTFVARVFFVWTSVINLFIVSIFWSFLSDIFQSGQAKRLFGFIGVGGTLGAMTGSGLTGMLVEHVGSTNLLFGSMVLFELAVRCVRRLHHLTIRMGVDTTARHDQAAEPTTSDSLIGGSVFSGVGHVFSSPYLIGICIFIFLYTFTSTFAYFIQANIIAAYSDNTTIHTKLFAWMDFCVNGLSILTQAFVTGRLLSKLGVAFTLCLLPALTIIGFSVLALTPSLVVIFVFQVLRRGSNYGIAKPSREVLFTVISREDKYKSKAFIDTVIYRGGDAVTGFLFTGLQAFGLALGGIAITAVPIAGIWMLMAVLLGRRQKALAAEVEAKGLIPGTPLAS